MELFYDDDLHFIWKGKELLAKEIIHFYYHLKQTVVYSKPSFRDIAYFSFNCADFPPISSKSFTVNSTFCLKVQKVVYPCD